MKSRNKYKTDWIGLAPFLLCLAVIPVIVKTHTFKNPLLEYPWYLSYEYQTDFFLYYKAAATICCGVLILLLLLMRYKKERITAKDLLPLLPLAGYEILTVLSSLFSDHAWFSVHGMPDQFESVFVLLAYGILCLYAYGYVYESDSRQWEAVLKFFLCGVCIVGAICTLQFFHVDIYRLIYSGRNYTFSFLPGVVYGPFYNINYVGSYVTLVLPLCVMLLFSRMQMGYRILSGVCIVLLLFALIGGDSLTGLVAAAAVAVFCLLFLLCRKLHDFRKNILLLVGLVAVFLLFFGKPVYARLISALEMADTEKTELESIITNDSNVEFHYNGHTLYLSLTIVDGELFVQAQDEDLQPVACTIETVGESGYYRVDDARFGDCTIEPTIISEEASQYGIVVNIGGSAWCISNQIDESGTYYYVTSSRKAVKLTGEEKSGDIPFLEKLSFFANGRGYLWNKSLVISAKYIFLGSGADTFALAYPNDDYVDKSNNGYGGLVVTRPHNLYLQTAVQTGWLSLICLLAMFGWYLISSLRIYYHARFDRLETYAGFGIMLGVTGYLITGIANDSTVTVAPVFWMLLGLGIAFNHNVKCKSSAD